MQFLRFTVALITAAALSAAVVAGSQCTNKITKEVLYSVHADAENINAAFLALEEELARQVLHKFQKTLLLQKRYEESTMMSWSDCMD